MAFVPTSIPRPAAAPRAVVTGIAPASACLAALPAFLRLADPDLDRLAILHASRGSSAAAAARQAGLKDVAVFPFTPPLADRPEVLILGRFRLDPAGGRQVGYRPVVVGWRGGRKCVVAPAP